MSVQNKKRDGDEMAVIDDRKEFLDNITRQSEAMGKDQALFDKSKQVVLDADKYDYSYLWTWLGVPIIQMPADIIATQEIIWRTKPDVIIETGVARGGSVLFLASMLELVGKGKVVGVDVDIRAHNRQSIETHKFAQRITLVEGGSTDPSTLAIVKSHIKPGDTVMVILDSDHSYAHVLAECRLYGELVTAGQYMIVADTLVGHLKEDEAPQKRSKLWFKGNDPLTAANEYLVENKKFEIDPVLNGKLIMSSSPGGYLKRVG
jgi:cephalosporin hydroxylase